MTGPSDRGARRWRLVVHALDRTGPPMLVRAFARWLAEAHPGERVDILAFRGGPLEPDLAALGRVVVVLDPEEPWDHDRPSPARVGELRARLADLEPVDATLLVSTSAGQVLPLLPRSAPTITWSVEMGEDLHWFDGPIPLLGRTDRWLAGSQVTAAELSRRGVSAAAITVVPEFVERPGPVDAETRAARRHDLGAGPHDLLVVGAGIGTHRKGMDLFVEVAAACRRRGLDQMVFSWIGGSRDPLFQPVRDEVARLGLDRVDVRPEVDDIDPWFAAADVVLHPAREDSFPLVCVHAAAVGTPVVAFAGVGGVEEMLGDTFLGAAYPDVAGLADHLQALTGADRRKAVGRAQREQVLARYVADVGAPALRSALEHAAGAGAAGLAESHGSTAGQP